MNALRVSELAVDRRTSPTSEIGLWEQLTLAQKFSASSLTQFGYKLLYVREAAQQSCIAILACNDHHATITHEGEIDTSPKLTLRA